MQKVEEKKEEKKRKKERKGRTSLTEEEIEASTESVRASADTVGPI